MPVAVFKDPFRKGENKIVLCDTYKYNKKPAGKRCRHLVGNLKIKFEFGR